MQRGKFCLMRGAGFHGSVCFVTITTWAGPAPRLTPRAMVIRASDPIDGLTWPYSAWEIRLREKPLLVARVRTDIPKARRSCRRRSPTFAGLIGGSS